MPARKNGKKLVGLIPAAGTAERISPLPCSKEIYPVEFENSPENKTLRPKVVSQYLLESMKRVEVDKAYFIIRKGKWDILNYLGSGNWMDMNFAYLIMDVPFGVPFTLDQAYHFVRDDFVVFGFPDIIFEPRDAFIRLLKKHKLGKSDVVVGLFGAPQPYTSQHMVKIDPGGQVCGFEIGPSQTKLKNTWIIALWDKRFTDFLHEYVSIESKRFKKNVGMKKDSIKVEVSMTQAFEAALHKGLKIDSVTFEEGTFLDIGSPDNLERISQNYSKLTIKDDKLYQ
jgi:glucose-1-phosphate thymidylyltransferase